MQPAVRIPVHDFRDRLYRLDNSELAVNCSYRHQDRVVPEKLPEVICVYLSIPSDVRKIDLIPLLLQPGKRSADRRMLQSC